jgi:flagellar basal-body rod protein FlgC
MDSISGMLGIARAGLAAQSTRLRIISENIANARSSPASADDTPYTRKMVNFRTEFDRTLGVNIVKPSAISTDQAPYQQEYNPTHESADARGYVRMPNVNIYVEMADLREANRAYQANLQSIRSVREIQVLTIDLLKG